MDLEWRGIAGNGMDFTDRLGKERTGVVGKVPDWISRIGKVRKGQDRIGTTGKGWDGGTAWRGFLGKERRVMVWIGEY